jgi:hypothetical protein
MNPKMSFCETCLEKEKSTYPMFPAEARIHQDNFPDHKMAEIDKTEEEFRAIEEEHSLICNGNEEDYEQIRQELDS